MSIRQTKTDAIDALLIAQIMRFGQYSTTAAFIRDARKRPQAIDEFDEKLWLAVIDQVTVDRDNIMTFRFKNGSEVTA